MASIAAKGDYVDYEALYQPKYINVEGGKFEKFGYILIGASTVIMVMQGLQLGPAVVWKRADDLTTVLFTFELLARIYEKGYLFCTEQGKNWNLFDALVVSISLFSMAVSAKAAQDAASGHGHAGGNSAMNKMKALRMLRLLRLLRLIKMLKGCPLEKVNSLVDTVLNTVVLSLVGLVVAMSVVALLSTTGIAFLAAAKAWLRIHSLPKMPEID